MQLPARKDVIMLNENQKKKLRTKKSFVMHFDKMEMFEELDYQDVGRIVMAIYYSLLNEWRGETYPIPKLVSKENTEVQGDNIREDKWLKMIYKQIINVIDEDAGKWCDKVKGLTQYADDNLDEEEGSALPFCGCDDTQKPNTNDCQEKHEEHKEQRTVEQIT